MAPLPQPRQVELGPGKGGREFSPGKGETAGSGRARPPERRRRERGLRAQRGVAEPSVAGTGGLRLAGPALPRAVIGWAARPWGINRVHRSGWTQFGGEVAGGGGSCGGAVRGAPLRQDGTPAAAALGSAGEHGRARLPGPRPGAGDVLGQRCRPCPVVSAAALRGSGSRRLVRGLERRRGNRLLLPVAEEKPFRGFWI